MLNVLTARQKYILLAVYEGGAMDVKSMADRLQVSRRTIQRDAQTLQSYLSAFAVTLDLSPSGVISLQGEANNIASAVLSAGRLSSVLALNPREREFYIISELLWSIGPVKLAYLGHRLGVADASISHDLDRLEPMFAAKGLQLVRKRGYGVEIVGTEQAKREMLAELLYDYIPIERLLYAWTLENEENIPDEHVRFIRNWFSDERIREVKRVLLEELLGMELPLHDAAFYSFMVHVLLVAERVRQDQALAQPLDQALEETGEYRVVQRVLARIMPDMDIPAAEVNYLADHLRGAKVQMTEENKAQPLNVTMMELAYRIAKEAWRLDHNPYLDDQHLIAGLAHHLEPALYRMKAGMGIRNPLLADIQRQFPDLYRVVAAASQRVLTDFGFVVPDAEVGYLTMHFGAALERWRSRQRVRVYIVCPNGISSAELLAGRIRAEFPQIEIVAIGAIQSIDLMRADFVISTVSLSLDERVVTVSPFLTEEDVQKIRRQLGEWQFGTPANVPEQRTIHPPAEANEEGNGLIEELGVQHVTVSSIAELISIIARDVQAKGMTEDADEVQGVINQREKLGSIVIPGKSLALLHARSNTMNRTHVAVYRLLDPISMYGVARTGEDVDTILVFLAPMHERSGMVAKLSLISSALITRDGFTEIVRLADELTVKETIRDILMKR